MQQQTAGIIIQHFDIIIYNAPYWFSFSYSFWEVSAQVQWCLLFPNCVCVAVKRNARTKDAEDLFRTITTEGKNQPWVVCAFGGEWWWLGDDSDVNKSGKVSKILDS